MKQMRKRLLCLALVLSMLVGLFAGTAAAAPAATASIYDIRVNDLLAPVGLDDECNTYNIASNFCYNSRTCGTFKSYKQYSRKGFYGRSRSS